jgi:hypothetical protein
MSTFKGVICVKLSPFFCFVTKKIYFCKRKKQTHFINKILFIMKKTFLILGLLMSLAFLYAQNVTYPNKVTTEKSEFLQRAKDTPSGATFSEFSKQTLPTQNVGASKGNIFDGAENHADFAIDSPGSVGWTYYCKPGSAYQVQGFTWPNVFESGWTIFNPSQTTPPMTQTAASPYEGDKYFACFSLAVGGGNAPNDHWIVSPELNADNSFSFGFWGKAFNTMYGPELIKVRYSTTTNAQSSFTNYLAGSASTTVSVPMAWTKYVYTVPSNAKFVAIQCVSMDAFYLMIDNIEILLESDCDPVSNLSINFTYDCKAELSWEGHSDAVSYEIWRDDLLIKTQTATSYFDDAFIEPSGAHTWKVIAVCSSGKSAPSTVTLSPCGACPIVADLTLTIEPKEVNCDATLTWAVPNSLEEGEISQCKGNDTYYDYEEALPGDPNDFTFAFRYLPEDFAKAGIVSGQAVNKVFLQMGTGLQYIELMQIRIWTGGTHVASPGQEVVTQDVNFSDFKDATGYWVTLNNPHIIDVTEELRIGYRMTWPTVGSDCQMVPFDKSPVVEEKGDLLSFLRGEYYVWFSSGEPNNYYIKAEIGKGISATPEWEYDIYRDGKLLIDGHKENSYSDKGIEVGSHSWMVKVNCTIGGLSVPVVKSGSCQVGVNEVVVNGFSILPNPATSKITIKADNNFNKAEIVNFLGQVVVSQNNSTETTEIDVSNLTNGVYFVRIISDNGTSVQKFVKQ